MKKMGLIVNPIAGMSGAVGLKGTDGEVVLEKALALGAKPVAPARAEMFLSKLRAELKEKIQLITGAGQMGENEARNCGFTPMVIGEKRVKPPPRILRSSQRLSKRRMLIF